MVGHWPTFNIVTCPIIKNIVLGVVYRPPKVNLRDFVGNLDSFMAKLSSENKVCYVMADWNLDLMKHHRHDLTPGSVSGHNVFAFFCSIDYSSY